MKKANEKVVVVLLLLVYGNAQQFERYDEISRCVRACNRYYNGALQTSISGKRCRPWRQGDFDPIFSNVNVGDLGSFCRNPDYRSMPFCYVNDTEWEFCFSSTCPERNYDNNCGLPGFYRFNNSCFMNLASKFDERKSANKACKRLANATSPTLTNIHSEEEMIFVRSLSCLPVLMGARRNKNYEWRWSDNTTWGISNGKSEWPWCTGFPVDDSKKRCLIMQPDRCFRNVNCKDSGPYYSSCNTGVKLAPYSTRLLSRPTSWQMSSEQCRNQTEFRLCYKSEVCQRINSSAIFFTSNLPLAINRWIPIADEYKDWIYVGPDSQRQCQAQSEVSGPVGVLPQSMLFCCRKKDKNDDAELPQARLVPVYIRSLLISNVVYYKYSLNKENTMEEILTDTGSWLNTQRYYTDISSFYLWSHYKRGVAETIIYFCKRTSVISRVRTTQYSISLDGCQNQFMLDFYLYGSITSNPASKEKIYAWPLESNQQQSPIRLSSSSMECCGYRNRSEGFVFYANSSSAEFTTSNRSACSQLLRLQDLRGIVSSPNYPNGAPLNSKCRWRIIGPVGSVIRFNFTVLNLDSSGNNHEYFVSDNSYEKFREVHGVKFNHNQNCELEYVQVSTTKLRRKQLGLDQYGTFCGFLRPPSFMTLDNVALIELNNRNSKRIISRFSLRYEILPPPFNLTKVAQTDQTNVQTYLSLAQQCSNINKRLCSINDICRYDRPFYKIEQGNVFAPVRDEFNDWVQTGRHLKQTCLLHNQFHGPPLWGIEPDMCDEPRASSCPTRTDLYCCDAKPNNKPSYRDTFISIEVLFASYSGVVFNRYFRPGIDDDVNNELWQRQKLSDEDVSTFTLSKGYTFIYNKTVYFCSRQLRPAFGPFSVVYTMQNTPCVGSWRLQFYFYASSEDQVVEDGISLTQPLFIGMSVIRPHHSRITFNSYAANYDNPGRFVIYAYTSDVPPPPKNASQTSNSSTKNPPVVSSCQRDHPKVLSIPVTITSPNYPGNYEDNQKCSWIVNLSDADKKNADAKLMVTIEDIYLEESADCVSDKVEVSRVSYNEDIRSYRKLETLGKRCGRIPGDSFISDQPVLIEFRSDGSVQKTGFKLSVSLIVESCGGLVTDNGADVVSPGYPIRYNPGLNCTWEIQSQNPGYHIEIQFVKLHLLPSTDCADDRLIISYPGVADDLVFCGRPEPPRLPLPTDRLTMRLVTRNRSATATTEQGFSAFVYFVPRNGSGSGRCGVADVAPWPTGGSVSARVIGGLEAIAGSWPWVARLDGATCGGALINNKWVLTAAHCVVPRGIPNQNFSNFVANVSHITVVLGRHVNGISTPATEQTSKIQRVYVYSGYVRERPPRALRSFGRDRVPTNDIALLRLQTPVRISSRVKPICLPLDDAPVGKECVVAGWGIIGGRAPSGVNRNALQYGRLPILKNSLCNSFPALAGAVRYINICAGYAAGGVDACQGDSGGPLMCLNEKTNSYEIHGIVSWGKQCGLPRQPGIYTRVWPFIEWITGHVYSEL